MTKLASTSEQKGEQKGETPRELTEHPRLKAFVYPFEVIVSPFKAFKEIAQNPDFKGIVLIVGLILLATAGTQYVSASKVFLSVSQTQSVSPKLHTYLDAYVYETAFGNYTFKSSQPYIMNYTFIDKTPLIQYSVFWVNSTEPLTPMNSVITTANDTFYQITIKLNQSTTEVGNLTLTMKFYSDTTPKISTLLTKGAQWSLGNYTINWFISSSYTYLANGTTAIDLSSKATLSLLKTNVKSVELGSTASPNNWGRSSLIDWSDYGNATLYGGHHTLFTYSATWLDVVFNVNDTKIDPTTVGLTYSSLLATNRVGGFLLEAMTETVFIFLFNWLIYAGALLLIARLLGEKGSPWLPFFILVGYTFSIFIIRTAVSAVLISTLPGINFHLATWPPATQADVTLAGDRINEIWGSALAFQVGIYFNLVVDAWLVILGAIAVHASREIAWRKAATISFTAYFIYFILRFFFGV